MHVRNMLEDYYPARSLRGFIGAVKTAEREPVYHAAAALSNRILGRSLLSTRAANLIWFAVLLISVYYLAGYIMGREAGILSVLIISMYPAIYGSSRIFAEEFSTMSLMPLAVLFLLKSDGFRNMKYSLLFGLVFGLGMLTRGIFLVFIAGPAIYVFASAVIKTRSGKTLLYFLLSLAVVFLVTLCRRSGNVTLYTISPFLERYGRWYSFENLRTYTVGLSEYQLTPVFFAVFLWGLYVFIRNRRRDAVILTSWIIIPLLLLILMPRRKCLRYSLPYMPAIALLSAYGIDRIRSILLKTVIITLMLLVGTAQYFEFSFGPYIGLENLGIHLPGNRLVSYFSPSAICGRPTDGSLYYDIGKSIEEAEGNRKLLILPSHTLDVERWRVFAYFESPPFEVQVIKNDHDIRAELLDGLDGSGFAVMSGKDRDLGLPGYADYIFITNGQQKLDAAEYKSYKQRLTEALARFNIYRSYEDVNRYNSLVHLLKKR
ncbi:MAG: glycosyltransferase family 39 protein [Elusimicrobia bacterium]|nr:glycosyltransferase family 39 protein [Elusimicrobiota bacterium]